MGLFKRGKVWWMDLMYQGQRIRRSTGVKDKRLAEQIYAKVLTEIVEGRWFERIEEKTRTFRELMERYDKEYFSHLPGSRRNYSYFNQLVDFFGDYTLAEITPRLINEFKTARKAQGVKPATINRQITIAKRAFNVAIRDWEWCRENPFAKVSSEKGATKRDRWLTFEEEERLLNASPPWVRDLVLFAAWTGIRLGNIRELKWSQVDLFRKTIYLGKTKNGNPVVIPMNQKVFTLLKEKMKIRHLNHDLVFTTATGKPIEPGNLRRAFKRACKKAGIEDLRIHDLRHTYGTRLAQAGVDLYTIAKLLGHQDIRTTQRYAHHCTASLKRGVDILERELDTILTHFDEKRVFGDA